MSIDLTCFSWVQLILKSDLSPNAKYIALYLSTYMNLKQDIAWPAQSRIADETGLSIRTIIRMIKELSDTGWISTKKAGHAVNNSKQTYLHNEYIIQIPLDVRENIRGDIMSWQLKSGVTQTTSRGDTDSIPGVSQCHTNNNRITKNINREKIKFPFWEDMEGWIELGRQHGVNARAGESQSQFQNRVKRKLSD